MPSIDNYNRQLHLLDNLKTEILGHIRRIDHEANEYRQHISKMHQAGFMEEYVKGLNNRYSIFKQMITIMTGQLQANLKNIDEHKRIVTERMNIATRLENS